MSGVGVLAGKKALTKSCELQRVGGSSGESEEQSCCKDSGASGDSGYAKQRRRRSLSGSDGGALLRTKGKVGLACCWRSEVQFRNAGPDVRDETALQLFGPRGSSPFLRETRSGE